MLAKGGATCNIDAKLILPHLVIEVLYSNDDNTSDCSVSSPVKK